MEFSFTRVYVIWAITMVAAAAFFVSLGIPWWGTVGGLFLVFVWCANSATTSEMLLRIHKTSKRPAATE